MFKKIREKEREGEREREGGRERARKRERNVGKGKPDYTWNVFTKMTTILPSYPTVTLQFLRIWHKQLQRNVMKGKPGVNIWSVSTKMTTTLTMLLNSYLSVFKATEQVTMTQSWECS